MPFRIAMIGLGPKGLYALESLLAQPALRKGSPPVHLTLYEPHPYPGAGPIYDPRQPAYLRMNFAAKHINAWDEIDPGLPIARLSLLEWLKRKASVSATESDFLPRALVGRYLHWCFRQVLHAAPKAIEIKWKQQSVVRVHRSERCWWLETGKGEPQPFDEVLITTGHHSSRKDGFAREWQETLQSNPFAQCIPSVFPTGQWLNPDQVPPGSNVAIRGMALTWIDATLALFEGRGGHFNTTDHPWRLQYRPGKDEVALVVPFSRTGRLMRPKPAHDLSSRPALQQIWQQGSEEVLTSEAKGPEGVDAILMEIVTRCASQAFHASRNGSQRPVLDPQNFQHILTSQMSRSPQPRRRAEAIQKDLEHSLDVATGQCPPDALWALGETWRQLYGALVARISHGGLSARSWPGFAAMAQAMERIAFGPPVENLAKMLALAKAHRIDFSFAASPTLRPAHNGILLSQGNRQHNCSVLIDAVLPAPGADDNPPSLTGQLIAQGYARRMSGCHGLEVTASAACIGRNGITPGLSIIGRATEGCALGNDTLSRRLHHHPRLWAERIARRLAIHRQSKEMVSH